MYGRLSHFQDNLLFLFVWFLSFPDYTRLTGVELDPSKISATRHDGTGSDERRVSTTRDLLTSQLASTHGSTFGCGLKFLFCFLLLSTYQKDT